MMGAPGWDDAPPAKFRLTRKRRHVTLIWPYYENPEWLHKQIADLIEYRQVLRDNFTLIVSDDGSPDRPAETVLREAFALDLLLKHIKVRLVRIKVDVRWNWLAARNAAASVASGWCLFTDIDHAVSRITLDGLQRADLDPEKFYTLRRTQEGDHEIHSHPNSFFCRRDLFWKAGGYDEELSGHYGTDGDWRRRAAATAPVEMLPLYLDRFEHWGDSSTTHYKRKQAQDAGKKAILRTRGPGWRPRVLSFPWEEIKL